MLTLLICQCLHIAYWIIQGAMTYSYGALQFDSTLHHPVHHGLGLLPLHITVENNSYAVLVNQETSHVERRNLP